MKTKIFRITYDDTQLEIEPEDIESSGLKPWSLAKVEDITDEVAEWKRDADILEDQRMDNKFEKF